MHTFYVLLVELARKNLVIATLVGLRLRFRLGLGVVAGGLAAADVVELGALLDAEEGLDELRQFGGGL